MEKELGVEIGDQFAGDGAETAAGCPPAVYVVSSVLPRDDPNLIILAQGALVQNPGSTRVHAQGEDVQFASLASIFEPRLYLAGGGIGPVAPDFGRRDSDDPLWAESEQL